MAREIEINRLVSDDDIVLLDFEVHGGPVKAITRAAMERCREAYEIDDITTLDDYSRGWERYLVCARKFDPERYTKT